MPLGCRLAKLPLPALESLSGNILPPAELGNRQTAGMLPLDPLLPLIPKNLIHFSSHD
jgi:hypothetical protein